MSTVIALFFLAAMSLLGALYLPEQAVRAEVARADAGAASMLAYREAVVDYLNAHPGFSGTVPDASLAFPWGYRRDARWAHLVQGGALYVYEAPGAPAAGLLEQLDRKTLHSFTVGRNRRGELVGASGFATGIVVPAAVPDRAVMIFGK